MPSIGSRLTKGLVPSVASTSLAGSTMQRMVQFAIEGMGRLPSAKESAAAHLARSGSVDGAIEGVIRQHIGLAGAQGFVSNVGGVATLAASLPANIVGIALVQTRMVAAIAHLRGYDIDAPQVRTALVMLLLGNDDLDKALSAGELPTRPMAVATAPVHDPKLDRKVAGMLAANLTARVTGKRAALFVTKRVPVLGGVVGGGIDGYDTRSTGQYAKQEMVTRRPRS